MVGWGYLSCMRQRHTQLHETDRVHFETVGRKTNSSWVLTTDCSLCEKAMNSVLSTLTLHTACRKKLPEPAAAWGSSNPLPIVECQCLSEGL